MTVNLLHISSNDLKNGLWFAEMSFNSCSGKSWALDISYFIAQVMLKFTENSGMTFAKIRQSSTRNLPKRK